MAGIGVVLDLLKKSPGLSTKSLHSSSSAFFSASIATTAAASALTFFPNYPSFASQFLLSGAGSIAYCDAAIGRDDIRYSSDNVYRDPTYDYASSAKTYNIELKPLFSAFSPKTLGMTTLRALVMFYLPLLEPRLEEEHDDDENFEDEQQERQPVDLVVPLKKSVKQIFRETAMLTTRRVLERLAVHYVSQRMAWKLLKDLSKSADRKACRHLSRFNFFLCVSRTTFRGHFLGVAASWFVQVGIEVYHYVSDIWKNDNESNRSLQEQVLRRRVLNTTVRCGFSLVFASIGAGLGAMLMRPSSGQWLGCAVGDMAGPCIAGFLIRSWD